MKSSNNLNLFNTHFQRVHYTKGFHIFSAVVWGGQEGSFNLWGILQLWVWEG